MRTRGGFYASNIDDAVMGTSSWYKWPAPSRDMVGTSLPPDQNECLARIHGFNSQQRQLRVYLLTAKGRGVGPLVATGAYWEKRLGCF